MNQETSENNATQTATSPPPAKRNPLERLLVWGSIIVLLAIVLIEYRAKQSYDSSVAGLQEVADGSRDILIDEARQLMVGFSESEGPIKDAEGLNTYHYQWFSLFKKGTYQLTLVENEDHLLKTFHGPAFAEDPDVLAAKIKEANSDLGDATPPLIGNAKPQEPSGEVIEKESESTEQDSPAEKQPQKNDFLN